eukprot:Opistho-1_new@92633
MLLPDLVVAPLARAIGVQNVALRLLLGVLTGYPLALAYRKTALFEQDAKTKHVFFAATGMVIGWYVFGIDFLHTVAATAVTYAILLVLGQTSAMVAAAFIFNMAYLLTAYVYTATEGYDITFTTAHCVLTLRLIMLAWDYYDGKLPPEEIEKDAKTKAAFLKKLPGPLEVLGYCFFFGGYLVGPLFPYRRYESLIQGDIHSELGGTPATSSKREEMFASSLKYALSRLGLGLLYVLLYPLVSSYAPSSYLLTNEFLNETTFWERLWFIWWMGKFALMKYLGVWLITEGTCVLSGLSYEGKDKDSGRPRWSGLANIKVLRFETSPSLQGIIESFNINTNAWALRYVFKRLRFLGNKHISSAATLFFLAIWHGFHPGYFLTFGYELFCMEAERRVSSHFKALLEQGGPLAMALTVVAYILRSFIVHYALVGFELLSFSATMTVYASVYFVMHVLVFGAIAVDVFLASRRKASRPPKKVD